MNYAPQPTKQRPPDCVTRICKGNTILTVSGYYKQDATETAVDKMAKVLAAESITEAIHKTM